MLIFRRAALVLAIFLCTAAVFAKEKPAATIATVHVSSSHVADEVTGTVPIENTYTHEVYGQNTVRSSYLLLTATVDGHKYEMKSLRWVHRRDALMDPGDYQAKVSESRRGKVYELLLSNGKTRKFYIVGTSE
jgi:hypothetical protein